MRLFLFAFTLILLLTFRSFSQENTTKFEHIDIHNGLSENYVNSIIQDDLGFIWVGTTNGLNRYDGYSFKVFKFQRQGNYILSGFINKLFKDYAGNIWIGTNDGLQCFKPKNESFTLYQHSDNKKSLSTNLIYDIYSTSDSILWIGVEDGLCRFNLKTKVFKTFKPNSNILNKSGFKRINAITGDKNNLYLGSNTEILSFNLKEETFKAYKYKYPISSQAIYLENPNKLLIGTYGSGLFSLDVITGFFSSYSQIGGCKIPNIIQSILKLKNRIYLGTSSGLFYISNFENTPQTIHYWNNTADQTNSCPNSINCLSYDKSGNLWIGSQQDGCFKLNLETKSFKNYPAPFNNKTNNSSPIVRTILEFDSTHLIIGTLGSGLYSFNRKTAVFNPIKFTTNDAINKITSVRLCKQHYILIGTEGAGLFVGKLNKMGLNSNNFETKSIIRYSANDPSSLYFPSSYIMSTLEDHNQNIWIGTWGGLVLCKMTTNGELKIVHTFEKKAENNNSLSSNNILCIYEDTNGVIWAGTRKGLNKISVNKYGDFEIKNYFVNQNTYNGLISNVVISIYEDKNKLLWVGTSGGGIAHFDRKTEQFTHYTIDEKIGSNNIAGILEDSKENLWLGTSKGLLLFDPKKKKFINYYENNDKSNDYLLNSCIKTKNDELYFGNTVGFTGFNPLLIEQRTFIPPTVISGFSIFNRQVPIAAPFNKRIILENSISYTKELTIKHYENAFTFEFASLDFYSPDKNQYMYKLEGFDNDWIYTNSDKRFATYSNLNAGNYIFKVKGTNSDGIWNETPRILQIKILAPWWKTWWAKILYVVIFSLILSLYLRYRIRMSELRNNLRFEHLEREKLNEVHQMKLRFFANISHEFRTPLTLVIAPLEKILKTKGLDNGIKYQLETMSRNVNRLLRLINQILDLAKAESQQLILKPKNDDFVNYISSLLSTFNLKAEQQSIELHFKSNLNSYCASFDHDVIEKIIYNLLSNAFNHTPANGIISVSLQISNSSLAEIRVKDTGVGIPKDFQERIFERFFQIEGHSVKAQKGTGLGLSLVKALVDIYKGTIEVNSFPGEGAEFIVTLPLYMQTEEVVNVEKLSPDAESIEVDDISEKTTVASISQTKTMLIVEDNPEMRAYIRNIFEAGYKIKEASEGKEGLDKARKNMPDIIISDVMMPGIDGMEFCKSIKTDERTSHIPVLMLTALDSNESRVEGIETGADAYLTKPFNVQHLEASVKALIASREKLKSIFGRKIMVDPAEVTVTSTDEKFLRKLMEIFEKKINDPNFNVESICTEISMSRTNLHHKIKAITGQTSSEFLRSFRIKRAGQLLLKGLTVSETMYEIGISSRSYFIKSFKEIFEELPSEYGKKGSNNPIDA